MPEIHLRRGESVLSTAETVTELEPLNLDQHEPGDGVMASRHATAVRGRRWALDWGGAPEALLFAVIQHYEAQLDHQFRLLRRFDDDPDLAPVVQYAGPPTWEPIGPQHYRLRVRLMEVPPVQGT